MTKEEVEDRMEIVEKIREYFPDVVICGSLALYFQGYNLPRNCGDIDLIIPKHSNKNSEIFRLLFNDLCAEFPNSECSSMGEFTHTFMLNFIRVDVRVQNHEEIYYIEAIAAGLGANVEHVSNIIPHKINFLHKRPPRNRNYHRAMHKHYNDLVFLKDQGVECLKNIDLIDLQPPPYRISENFPF